MLHIDCRAFRSQHAAFLDQTLSDAALLAMQTHLAECEECARFDTVLRRGLLVLRNLPSIQPSPEFRDRLNARLRAGAASRSMVTYQGPSLASFLTVTASVMAMGFLAVSMLNGVRHQPVMTLPPVVATRPAMIVPTPVVSSGFIASASVGFPLWSAEMAGEQLPAQYVGSSSGIEQVGLTR